MIQGFLKAFNSPSCSFSILIHHQIPLSKDEEVSGVDPEDVARVSL